MAETPRLPRSLKEWILVFGPGAIMASITIGTGELIFSTRGGALFGYDILFVFALTSLLKWSLVISTSRHIVLTGVHPYERMLDLPGPRGWLPILLLLISIIAMPVWVGFHSSVLGNLTAWVTNTRDWFHGGSDYVWGALILSAVMLVSALGQYAVLEKTQTVIVLTMVLCAALTLLLYNPDWLELLSGLLPHRLSYPAWLSQEYPDIARHSVWVETTRYIGVIGGAGFDYLCYTSWLREKSWGVLPNKATPEQLAAIAADPEHDVRKWINAPLVDCAISFTLVVLFSAVFVASGAMFLGPAHRVPNDDNMLNLQSQFVTQVHPWLLPLYIVGAFLTMLGTLYGTVEIAATIADEIVRSFVAEWTAERARLLRRGAIAWSVAGAFVVLGWLFARQAAGIAETAEGVSIAQTADHEPVRREKPKVLIKMLTPVNLFTGILSCGLICLLTLWMDRRWLPRALWPPFSLTALNAVAGLAFLALGVKGVWDNEDRLLVLQVLGGLLLLSWIVAWWIHRHVASAERNSSAQGLM